MLGKSLQYSFLVIFSFISTYFLLPEKVDVAEPQLHPGWYDHFLELKGDENGELPSGLVAQWNKEDRQNKLQTKKAYNSLTNIQEIGPTNVGGRTRSIAIDYSNTDHLVVAGVSGGLWNSYDNGASWEIVNDTAPTLSATTIEQSPFDSSIFYYGTGEARGNSADIFGMGIFKSTNNAKTFAHLANTATTAFDEIWDLQHSLVFDSTLYVATDQYGLWVSKDAGASFTKVFNTSRRIQEVKAKKDSTLLFAVDGLGIYSFDEKTEEATKLANGWPSSGYSRISFDYCKNYPNVIYAHLANSNGAGLAYALKSSNGGDSWQETNQPITTSGYNFAWYCFKVGVAPADSTKVFSLSVAPFYSSNSGESWIRMANPHADYHEIQWYNDNEFLLGNDGGVHSVNLNDVSRSTSLNNGLNITQFYAGHYAPLGNSIVGGTQDNGTRYSNNGAEVFSRIYGGDGSYCHINQQDPSIRYVSYQNLNMFRQEGGFNYPISNSIRNQVGGDNGVWFINPFTVNDLDGDQVFVPTKREIYRSTNAGTNWSKLTADLIGDSYCVGLSNDENPIAYIGGTGSRLYRVKNAATAEVGNEVNMFTTKYPLFLSSTIGCIDVDPTDRSTIYVGMTNYSTRSRIWKIENADSGEAVYYDISNNLPSNLPVNWVEVDPENPAHIYLATDYGLYSSLNGGASWQKDYKIPNVPIDMIKLRSFDRKLFIFTHGRGIWAADLLENPVANIKPATLDIKVYPNPAQEVIRVKSGTNIDAVTLYNRNGVLVKDTNTPQLGVSDLANGLYFIEVKTGNQTLVEKVIIKH